MESNWEDPLIILNRLRVQTHSLRNLLAGHPAFLIGGGPSANDLPLELLGTRGIWSICVNNSAGHPRIRPQAFVCSDPPKKFSHSIWLDPGIMKFVPSPKMNGRRSRLRQRKDGVFTDLAETVTAMPNVWGFQRNSWLYPDDRFFSDPGACWGNHEAGSKTTGQPKTVCTMLLALRLLYYLGARRIYLVGVDFLMTPERGYSFNQGRDKGASDSNNTIFTTVNQWLVEMMANGTFSRFGCEVYNCYEFSGLRAFSYVPFEDAIADARGIIEQVPDLAHWYDPEEAKK